MLLQGIEVVPPVRIRSVEYRGGGLACQRHRDELSVIAIEVGEGGIVWEFFKAAVGMRCYCYFAAVIRIRLIKKSHLKKKSPTPGWPLKFSIF